VYDQLGPTKLNLAAAIVVSAVDHSARRLTLTGNSADLDAIQTELTANGAGSVDAYYLGSFGAINPGIIEIASNTGVLHGIDGAVYGLWKGNSVAVGGSLTWEKIHEGIASAVGRGLDEDALLCVSPRTWSDLNNDLSALRVFDSSYEKKTSSYGSRTIEYFSMNGMIEVEPSIYMKEGEALLVPTKQFKRIGATDITFDLPDKGGEIFRQLEGSAGVELRAYTDQSPFGRKPAACVFYSGIVN
jgi:hypothetical protein